VRISPEKAAVILMAVCLISYPATGQKIEPAYVALQQGRADEAINMLQAQMSGPNAAEAHNLLCRVYLQEQKWSPAVQECGQAVQLDPKNSNYHMWLGRALGEKAERANGEFDASAPSLVGGGVGKAEAVLKQLEPLDKQRAHLLHARIAESKSDAETAEAELRAATSLSRRQADSWMNLASFYRRHERWTEMEAAVKSGINADPEHTSAQVMGAQILMRAKRNSQLAAQLLSNYLASPHKSEDEPTFAVHVTFFRLKQDAGNHAGALHQLDEALALAHDYKPALDAKNGKGYR
jgi:tetratricopeptide (TPR) repeat protein